MNIVPMILAAGKGTRMKSTLPKVLHPVAGKPMIEHVMALTDAVCKQKPIVVVGHGAQTLVDALGERASYVVQEPQLGTGHAVQQGYPLLPDASDGVFIICGDTPLLRQETIMAMREKFTVELPGCVLLTALLDDPTGYGRIVRDATGNICRIVEEKDATPAEKAISEVNTGTYIFNGAALGEALASLKNDNAQGEYYLTDTISYLAAQGKPVLSVVCEDFAETLGVNDRVQLAQASAILRQRKNIALMRSGVTLIDPFNTYIDWDVVIGPDTLIEPGCSLRGVTVIGSGCYIGPHCDITDSRIGNHCHLQQAVLLSAQAGDGCRIGPFAYLRPGACLADGVKVGDFVEVKNSQVGKGSKLPHLSYIGDACIGEKVNIGCGTITCNYDGYEKHQTIVKDGAFIGSNTNLVAPVTVGVDAFVAAGSTITKEVPDGALAVARGEQKVKEEWSAKRHLLKRRK